METRQDVEFRSRNELLTQFMRGMPVRTALRGGIYVVVHESSKRQEEQVGRLNERLIHASN